MNIYFDRNPGRISDILDSLYLICNKNYYEKFFEKYNLEPNKLVSETLKYLDENSNFDWKSFKFLFDDSTEYINTIVNTEDIWNIKDEKCLIDYIKNTDLCILRDRIVKRMLKTCDINEDEWDFSKTDHIKITNLLAKMDIEQELKWQIFCFIQNLKYYFDLFEKNFEEYLKVYNMAMYKNKNIIENFSDKLEKNINENGMEYFNGFSKNIIKEVENIYVTTSFINSCSLQYHTYKNKACFIAGIDYEKTFELLGGLNDIDKNLKILKNLSDNSRFQIINLLKDGECYGQEIADKVGISTATLNYHMDFLLASDILRIGRQEGRKTYFTLNKEPIKNCIRFLQNTLDLD